MNFVIQQASVSSGPWAAFAQVPGTATSPGKTLTIAPAATLCVRMKAQRIADSLDSKWTPAVCATAPKAPDAPMNVTIIIK